MRLSNVLSRRLKRFKPGTEWSEALCPFHKDTAPSFFVNMKTGYWHCFGCGAKGWLQQLLDRLHVGSVSASELVSREARQPRRDPNEVNELPNYILGAYRKCPSVLLRAGFDKKLLGEYDVGFDKDNDRITFPIRSVDGRLVAVSGRNMQGRPKYQVYEEEYADLFPGYKSRAKNHLWNLHTLHQKIIDGGVERLFIVEGYKACLWLIQYGYDAVATMGAGMSSRQVKLLSKYDVRLVLFMDNDEAGIKATLFNYLELSRKQISQVIEYPPDKEQPDDLDEGTLRETLRNPQEFRRWFNHVGRISRQDLKARRSIYRSRKAV